MSPRRAVLVIILAGTLLRLALAAPIGLGIDESYMVSNARTLSLSYVDHPPLHVWIAGLAARLSGGETPFALRLPFILLFAGSTWFLYRLTEILFGSRAGLWAAIAFSLAPVLSIAAGSWVLPAGPLYFFLFAAAVVVAEIVFADPPAARPALRWVLAGALVGLALLSKYTAVFFLAGVFVFLVTTPTARRWLASPGPWLGGLVAAAMCIPVLVWNLQNDMAGLRFQGSRFTDLPTIKVSMFLATIGEQAVYLTPWLFLVLAYVLVRAIIAGPSEPKGWFLAMLAAGPIIVFAVLSFWVRSYPHWPMPGWLFALPLVGRAGDALAQAKPRLARGLAVSAAAVFAVFVAVFAIQAIGGGIVRAAPGGKSHDPTVDLVDWTALPKALSERGLLTADTVVAATNWTLAGKASYALGAGIPVLCLCGSPQHFALRQDQKAFAGRDVIVVFPAEKKRATPKFASYFASLTPLAPVEIIRAGETVLILDLMLGHDLQFPDRSG